MPNTDIKINYYLRQQKSIERKMMCHLFREINSIFKLACYRYIGMGAKFFTDFILFHNEFGFKNMISIEANSYNQEKYNFNKPLQCIEMEFNKSSEALNNIQWGDTQKNIIWLDYDGPLATFMLEDIETMISKLTSESMFFISFNSQVLGSVEEKEEKIRQNIGEYCPVDIEPQQLAPKNINEFFRSRVIKNVIETALGKRNLSGKKLNFQQLLFFKYSDGADMTTLGGILLDDDAKTKFDKLKLDDILDFVSLDFEKAKAYDLSVIPLTYKEVVTLLKQLPRDDLSTVKVPGLTEDQIEAIARLYRYYPFYIETNIFN